MIPAIFRAAAPTVDEARELSGARIGIAGATGAFAGVLVNIAFRQSSTKTGQAHWAYIAIIACYLLYIAVTWVVCLRPGMKLAGG